MTVAELGRRMSSSEFGDWLRYAEVEPFGPLAEGAAAAQFVNYHRDPKKRPEPFTAAEALGMFAFDRKPSRPVDLGQKIAAALAAAAVKPGGKVVRRPAVRRAPR